jgi:hypothetical protein
MPSSHAKPAVKHIDRRRRRHIRFFCDFDVMLICFHGDKYQTLQGRARDLSKAGIGLLIAAELKVGDVVELKFTLPGSTRAWEMRAVTRYGQGCQYGFEFLSLNDEQSGLLQAFLKTLKMTEF